MRYQPVILLLSILWMVETTNIWIEMSWIARDGGKSGTATLIPKGAKNDIAYSLCCVQRTYVPTILDVSTNMSHRGCTDVSFLSHSDSIFLFAPLQSAVTWKSRIFILIHVAPWGPRETWTPARKQWFLGQLEGHFTFQRTCLVSFIIHWQSANAWSVSTWGKLKAFCSHPRGTRNCKKKKLWPQFSCCSWQMSLLAGYSKWVCNHSLAKTGTLTWQGVRSMKACDCISCWFMFCIESLHRCCVFRDHRCQM